MKSIVYPIALEGKQISRPVICFDFYEFKNMMMGDLDTISSDLEMIKKDYSIATGVSSYDVRFHILNTYGNEFSFTFLPTRFLNPIVQYELDVYGYNGKLLLFSKNLPLFLETRSNILSGLLAILNDYHNGLVKCWKCKCQITIEEALKNHIDIKGFCNHCYTENF